MGKWSAVACEFDLTFMFGRDAFFGTAWSVVTKLTDPC